MSEITPKAVKVWLAANILAIEFDNGQTRYMRSHFIKDYLDAWSPTRGKGKRVNLIMGKHGICDHILLINISLLGHYQKARKDVDY